MPPSKYPIAHFMSKVIDLWELKLQLKNDQTYPPGSRILKTQRKDPVVNRIKKRQWKGCGNWDICKD